MGTHAQLMQNSEVYRTLVRRQIMQGDNAEAEAEEAKPGAAAAAVTANGTSSNTTANSNSSNSPRGGRTVRASS